ncbi:putative ATP-grasp-modified RiPP [Streptomyces sp. NBC_01456]|uniref:putative ATP-grasp-modified RiPP n=1 Tax=Streptomyces sp. NBC_01456 TaxID=2975868 RepID=UPI002E372011|nr:putative ATP-grasp-modified RiPP [Streptomyces sp. NBC_01456]
MTLTAERAATLAPSLFPRAAAPAADGPATTSVRPFGLTKAVPIAVPEAPASLPVLTLCPDRQISVTESGTPFIHEPSMKTAITTTSQTREDSQLATDTENDTD